MAVSVASAALVGLATAVELTAQLAGGTDPANVQQFTQALRGRLGPDLWRAIGLALATAALAWPRRGAAALGPATMLYLIPAILLPVVLGEPIGLVVDGDSQSWTVPAVVIEAGLIFGPGIVVTRLRRRTDAYRPLLLGVGLIGPPAITAAWAVAAFTEPTMRGAAMMVLAASAVFVAGVLIDRQSSAPAAIGAVATALSIQGPFASVLWPIVATACLIAGFAAAGSARGPWEHRSGPVFARRAAATA